MEMMSEQSGVMVDQQRERILVIDDEMAIRRSLIGVLQDEGFTTVEAESGLDGLQIVASHPPALVLLDIWMTGMDGLETLRRIKEISPSLPVIMISGHAAISTAMTAIKLGASDFIEKPLDLEATVAAVRRALGHCEAGEIPGADCEELREGPALTLGGAASEIELRPLVFQNQKFRGPVVQQRTLARSAILYGQGLHSGRKSGLVLEPLAPNSGIHFAAVNDQVAVPAHVSFVTSTGFATTLRSGKSAFGTIEHLMSALHAYGISNLLIKCHGEVPVFDGSAREFCRLFDEVGVEDQSGDPWYALTVPRTIRIGDDREFIQIEPSSRLEIDYTLEYPAPLGIQHRSFVLDSIENYRANIASCRTFGFAKDIGYLQKQGYALGGRFDNFVLFGEEGPVNDTLRFPDEPVRHKILDAIGDIFLLGRPIFGKITARMTGHSDNIDLLRAIVSEMGS